MTEPRNSLATHLEQGESGSDVSQISHLSHPLPLRSQVEDQSPFPVKALNPTLAGAVEAIQESAQAPVSLIAGSVLTASATAVQHLGDITMDGRRTPLNVYCLSIAVSGERKTECDKLATEPLLIRQDELLAAYSRELQEHQRRVRAHKSCVKKIERDNSSKEDKESQLEQLGPEPESPPEPVLRMSNITAEGAARSLYKWPSAAVLTSEGGTVTSGYGMREGRALATVATLSEFWDGYLGTSARSGDGIAHGRAVRLSMHLMLQPAAAEQWMSNPEIAGQGVLSRYLMSYPASTQGRRLYKALDKENDSRLQHYRERLLVCLRRNFDPKEFTIPAIPLTADAETRWIEFHDEIETRLPEICRTVKPFANKLAEHAKRVAGVLALIEDPERQHVTKTCIESGIIVVKWYLSEAERLAAGSADEVTHDAEELLKWLHSRGENVVPKTTILTHGPRHLRSKEQLKAPLEKLLEHGWIVRQPGSGKGERYEIRHPKETN